MDGEALVWLAFVAIWFISSVIKQIRGLGKGQSPSERSSGHQDAPTTSAAQGFRPPPPPSSRSRPLPPAPVAQVPDPIQDLMRQLGVEVPTQTPERRVASEHRFTESEHRQDRGEVVPTQGESLITASEHQQTRSETRVTASEHRQDTLEIRGTRSEHVKGDLTSRIPPRKKRGKTAGGRRASVSRSIRADLGHGGFALRKAFVLKEILDKPVWLRDPG